MNIKLLEFFHSVQGEGSYIGTPTAFLRFPGCNRKLNKMCKTWDGYIFICDTNLERQAKEYDLDRLIETIWEHHVCITGGEPFLRPYEELRLICEALLRKEKHIHFETNGTRLIPDWFYNHTHIACSPKFEYLPEVVIRSHEVKLLVSDELDPERLPSHLRKHPNVFLCPINYTGCINNDHKLLALQALRFFPQWRLGVQLHKYLKVK